EQGRNMHHRASSIPGCRGSEITGQQRDVVKRIWQSATTQRHWRKAFPSGGPPEASRGVDLWVGGAKCCKRPREGVDRRSPPHCRSTKRRDRRTAGDGLLQSWHRKPIQCIGDLLEGCGPIQGRKQECLHLPEPFILRI